MPGQRVNISVTGYPYMEFGFLTGKVMSVSLLADDESAYTVTISLPQDLCTSYGKRWNSKRTDRYGRGHDRRTKCD